MRYSIEISNRALRKLESMPKSTQMELRPVIAALAGNPRPAGAISVKELDKCYRLRHGDFRIVYAVYDSKLLVLVLAVADRKDVYTGKEIAAVRKELGRRLREPG